jgi:hypothetical protein
MKFQRTYFPSRKPFSRCVPTGEVTVAHCAWEGQQHGADLFGEGTAAHKPTTKTGLVEGKGSLLMLYNSPVKTNTSKRMIFSFESSHKTLSRLLLIKHRRLVKDKKKR